jgi:pimeloyl-ACP methyl ester carboxylesterase
MHPSSPRSESAQPRPRSHRFVANGLPQHVLEWSADVTAGGAVDAGQGGPPPTALLLHGYMDAAGTFDLLAPSLVLAGLRVLAPDMRGFGAGPRASRGSYYHFPDYVADVAAIVREAVPAGAPLFVVGHSMGGTIASLFTGAFPERVTRLAILEGSGPPDNPFNVAPARMRRWIDQVTELAARGSVGGADAPESRPTLTLEEARRRLLANHARIDRAVLETRLLHLLEEVSPGRFVFSFDPLHKTVAPMPFFAAAYREFASAVTCPVLSVSGGPDGFHTPDEAERLAAFKRLTEEELPTAGHMMHWTQPEALGEILTRFWTAAP